MHVCYGQRMVGAYDGNGHYRVVHTIRINTRYYVLTRFYTCRVSRGRLGPQWNTNVTV